jgi:hypothetical protein
VIVDPRLLSCRLRLFLLLCCIGCDPSTPEIDGLGARDAQADAGDLDQPLGYAVVASDYSGSSITLLDADGELLQQRFVHSGSTSAGLVTALSGDVVLPLRSGERGVLTLIDRFRTDVITRIELSSGKVLGQLKTHAPSTDRQRSSYSSNPQDYVLIDDHSAWVSRYEPNLAAEPVDPDQGLDLLHIDPTRFVRTDERIDFSRFSEDGERTNPNTGEVDTVRVHARPAGMVRVGEQLVVGVTTNSATFDAAGRGLVARVDLQRREVAEVLELEGLTSCGSVAPVPRDDTRVAVSCSGFERGVPRDSAGFVMLRVTDSGLELEHVWRAREHPDAALTRYAMVPLSATEVAAVATGEVGAFFARDGDVRDKLFRVDLVTGAQEEIFEAAGPYVLGGGAFDADRGLLLVPDASVDDLGRPTAGVRRFQRHEGGSFEALATAPVHDVLPARQVRQLY